MREGTCNRLSISLACVLGLALLFSAGTALAKKPAPPPPPDPDPVDTGTIYFTEDYGWGQMYEIQSDGTGYAALDAAVSGGAEPSLLLHPDTTGSDVRWFLQVEIADAANQLFAVSENGDKVRLLSDTTLHVGGRGGSYAYPRWAADDGLVAFCAVRYDRAVNLDPDTYDPDPDAVIVENETGQYLLAIDPETMTAVGQATFIPLPSWFTALEDSARNLVSDVSPTGLSIVYQSYVDYKGTWRADASNWTDPMALLSGSFLSCPRWSPDEAWICGFTDAGIQVISSSGGSLETVVADPADPRNGTAVVDHPFWSPSGTHIAYRLGVAKRTTTHEIHIVDVETGQTQYLCDGYVRGWR